jgi:hypothetical protein
VVGDKIGWQVWPVGYLILGNIQQSRRDVIDQPRAMPLQGSDELDLFPRVASRTNLDEMRPSTATITD